MKTFKQRNAAFKAATKAEQRVMIAKDVIEQIKARRYKPTHGVWVKMSMAWNKKVYEDKQVCELTKKTSM